MDKLFEKVKKISDDKKHEEDLPELTEEDVLKNHVIEMLDYITGNYEDTFKNSAENGQNYAILMIYIMGVKYRRVIDIHQLLCVPDSIQAKLLKYNLDSLMTKIKNMFYPFELSLITLSDFRANYDHDIDVNREYDMDAMILLAEW